MDHSAGTAVFDQLLNISDVGETVGPNILSEVYQSAQITQ